MCSRQNCFFVSFTFAVRLFINLKLQQQNYRNTKYFHSKNHIVDDRTLLLIEGSDVKISITQIGIFLFKMICFFFNALFGDGVANL